MSKACPKKDLKCSEHAGTSSHATKACSVWRLKNSMHVNDWPGARKLTASKEKETKKEDENVVAEDGCFLQEQPVGSHPQYE